ncbi:uncharacterized protein LOC113280333 [Papaver somniferum]|uniref:uncharacterized protein LOC113280333 n=1 Tax=Papaver somniferum TaxID=3469 RepID=UPI000E6F6773|nr:uncharacterized protein LOC113280333 [Papaver somniferum]
MAASLNAFAATTIGFCECELSSIKISQTPTGVAIHGKPEYEVSITNDCICTQLDVVINCPGFHSVEGVRPSIFEPTGADLCTLKSGGPVFYNDVIKFKYASDHSIALTPSSSRISCS